MSQPLCSTDQSHFYDLDLFLLFIMRAGFILAELYFLMMGHCQIADVALHLLGSKCGVKFRLFWNLGFSEMSVRASSDCPTFPTTFPFSRLTSPLSRSLVFPPEFGGWGGVGGDPRAGRQMFYSVGKRSEGGSVIMIAIGHARTPHPPSNATPPRTASIGLRNRSGRRSLFPSRSRGPRAPGVRAPVRPGRGGRLGGRKTHKHPLHSSFSQCEWQELPGLTENKRDWLLAGQHRQVIGQGVEAWRWIYILLFKTYFCWRLKKS